VLLWFFHPLSFQNFFVHFWFARKETIHNQEKIDFLACAKISRTLSQEGLVLLKFWFKQILSQT